jgi:GNAT superfamily N-acetyltransferase
MADIYSATDAQAPAITEMWKEEMDFHTQIDPFFARRDDAHLDFQRFVLECIARPEFLVIVAIEGAAVVGYGIAKIETYHPVFQQVRYGQIMDMYVNQAYRSRGIGEKLLLQIQKWFRSMQIYRLELRVVSGSTVGGKFWKKHGFHDHLVVLARDLRRAAG